MSTMSENCHIQIINWKEIRFGLELKVEDASTTGLPHLKNPELSPLLMGLAIDPASIGNNSTPEICPKPRYPTNSGHENYMFFST
ncbi:hypothetical protein J4401_06445 [Candidatus Woesearchaeota archaeon]|nr:hypothetical protein [Candidatus Woesearchaeota archaeon]